MIDCTELRNIASERPKDAESLLAAARYDGAIYLGGYVVELALKSRICVVLNWKGFPQTGGEFQNYKSFTTHNLDVLLSLSGVEDKIKSEYLAEWSAVAAWDPEARYNPIGSASKGDAELLLEAARTLLGMRELLERFIQLERTIAEEEGDFGLFALFLREDAGAGSGTSGYSGYSAKWDLIAAAPRIEVDRREALSYITRRIQQVFTPEELSQLSRIVLVDLANPEVEAINRAVAVQHGQTEIRDSNFFGLQIKHRLHNYLPTKERRRTNTGLAFHSLVG
jgi:HEPN domain-containing protein